jgi:integrase
VRWVDTENRVLRIPKDESSKNTDNWVVSLSDRTASALERWLAERKQYEKYAESDKLWLTRYGNPYESHSLNHVLERVCEIAGISTENRDLSWYSIRHSVGTFMTREEGLAAAQEQLRHKSSETTLRYDHAPAEDRRNALNRMG